jgi:very-short-patch-repair endonuclease
MSGTSGKQDARARRTAAQRARTLRKQLTPAEELLWARLRGRRFQGWKFVRQAPIGPYIVDFLCRRVLLVVEVDGATHSTDEEISHDERRTAFLAGEGYRVLRVGNVDIRDNLEGVEETILAALDGRL